MTAIADPPRASDPAGSWFPESLVEELTTALGLINAGIDELLAIGDRGDFMALGPQPLIDLLRNVEAARNRLPAVDHLLIEAVTEERLWEHTASRGPAGLLQDVLLLAPATARGRVRDAAALGTRMPLGEVLPPLRPSVAAAQRVGAIHPDQTRFILAALDQVEQVPGLHPDQITRAEETLLEHAAALPPAALRTISARIIDLLDPDGALPIDRLTHARRGITLTGTRPDGTCAISGSLTPALRAKLFTVLQPYAAPTPSTADGPDRRTPAQRTHDALEQACDLLLRSGELPTTGGIPTTLLVTIDLDTLTNAATLAAGPQPSRQSDPRVGQRDAGSPPRSDGSSGVSGRINDRSDQDDRSRWPGPGTPTPRPGGLATTADGMQLSLTEVLRIAEEAEIIPVYLNRTNGIICYGRTRRLATTAQTKALTARDGGCTFPGCTAPPQWCQRHHINPWITGGQTDLDNLTLVCGYHHREHDRRGWNATMINGQPHWIPPAWTDPEQKPLTNARTGIQHTLTAVS